MTRIEQRSNHKKRIIYVDAIKGFAIICVVLGHIVDGYISSGIFAEYEKYLLKIYEAIYAFHMPLCFGISGFLYSLAYMDSMKKVKKKKIYSHALDFTVVYVLFSCLFWAFKLLFAGNVNKQISMTDILLIWIRPLSTYWYLYVLIIFYVFFSSNILRKNNYIIFGGLLGLNILSCFGISNEYFQIQQILHNAIFFYTGMKLSEYKKNEKTLFKAMIIIISIFLYFFCLYNNIKINTMPIVNVVIALGISCLVWTVFEKLDTANIVSWGVQKIGTYMIEIYVFHVIVAAGVRTLFIHVGIESVFIAVTLNLCISIIIPTIIGLILKRLNIHDLIFRYVSSKKKYYK